MADQKIIDRIRKLLAMSQDISSEHEAEIATRRLHALLAKHNISMSDIESSDDEGLDEDFIEGTMWPWKRRIFTAISQLYFCETFYQRTRKNYCKYFVIGSAVNRMTAIHIIQRTIEMLERQARDDSRKLYGKLKSSFITSFCNAACERVYIRCMKMIEEARKGVLKDSEGNTLPVLASIYDQWEQKINEYLNNNYDLKPRSTQLSMSNADGIMAGRQAGDRVSLNTSLHSQTAPKQLGKL